MIESFDLTSKINKECTDFEFFEYCNSKIDENYKNIEEAMNNIEIIYNKYGTSALFNKFIMKLILEKSRVKLIALIMKYSDLYNNLSYQLLTSKYYQHRLFLADLLNNKKIENNDKFYIKKLLNDKITIVQKKIIKCVKKELFSDNEILEILNEMYESNAYIVTGSCPFLLTQLKTTHCKPWFDKMLKDESWLVRYNLCSVMNQIEHGYEEEYGQTFANDELVEIRSLFCTIIKHMKDEKNKYTFYEKMLVDKEDKIRYMCVKEIEFETDRTDDLYALKYYLIILKNVIYDTYIDIRVKVCEIFAKNMYRLVQKSTENKTELYNFFNDKTFTMYNKSIDDVLASENDFDFLLPFIESFLSDKKWRVRQKCADIIKMLSKTGEKYIINNLLYFHVSILNDQINEIRTKGLELFNLFIKEYGLKLVIMYKEEIKKMADNEKYAIRIVCVKILDAIVECEINDEFLTVILEIVDTLMLDNLALTKNELVNVLLKLKRYDWYNEKIQRFVAELSDNEKSNIQEITIK